MFVNFLTVQQSSRMKIPFGIAQVGKSFRNEITVKHFVFRSCEFEQMEMEFFVEPGTDEEWHRWSPHGQTQESSCAGWMSPGSPGTQRIPAAETQQRNC